MVDRLLGLLLLPGELRRLSLGRADPLAGAVEPMDEVDEMPEVNRLSMELARPYSAGYSRFLSQYRQNKRAVVVTAAMTIKTMIRINHNGNELKLFNVCWQ